MEKEERCLTVKMQIEESNENHRHCCGYADLQGYQGVTINKRACQAISPFVIILWKSVKNINEEETKEYCLNKWKAYGRNDGAGSAIKKDTQMQR